MQQKIQFYPAHAEGEFRSPEAAFRAAGYEGTTVTEAIRRARRSTEFVATLRGGGEYLPLVTVKPGSPGTFVLWRGFVGHLGSPVKAQAFIARMSRSTPKGWAIFQYLQARPSGRGQEAC